MAMSWVALDELPLAARAEERPAPTHRSGARPPLAQRRLRAILVVLDGAAALLAATIWGLEDRLAPLGLLAGLVTFVVANRVQGLYRSYVSSCPPLVYAGLMRSAFLFGVTTWLVSESQEATPHLGSALVATTLLCLTATVGRHAFDYWIGCRRSAGLFRRRVVVVAGDAEADRVVRLVQANPASGFEIVAVVGPTIGELDCGMAIAGPAESAAEMARVTMATGAVVCPAGLPPAQLHAAVRGLERAGVHVHVPSWMQGIGHSRLRSVEVGHESFLYLEPARLSRVQLAGKRTLDVVLAVVALVVTAPVLVVAALAVKLQDGGPILFRQERVGRGGRRFSIHKLRTMEVDAEHRLAELMARNERVGPLFKIADDPRVTRLGGFLRATSIDELPQLFDVLRGTMSLVGPRPPLPAEVEEFDDELLDRFGVRPGITGLWQVEGRDAEDFAVYRRLDLFYVENWSLLLDVGILLDTVPAVVGRALRVVRRPSPPPERMEVALLTEPEHLIP